MSAPRMLTSAVSRAVQQRINQVLQEPGSPAFTERLTEFGDVRYLLSGNGAGALTLSFGLPAGLEPQWTHQMLGGGARQALEELYGGIASWVAPPCPGYQVTLRIDMRLLGRLQPTERDYWVDLLSSLRLHVTGAPLRRHCMQLAAGALQSGPIEAICSRPGQVYYVKPHAGKLTVILPVRFVSDQDAVIGHALLQEFVEARRTAALGLSPSCAYYSAKSPPLELQGLVSEPGSSGAREAGYLCFTLHPRHVAGPQLEHIVWSLATFYTLIAHQIKACKVLIHSRLRAKLDAMLHQLPPSPSTVLLPISRPVGQVAPGSGSQAGGTPTTASPLLSPAASKALRRAGGQEEGALQDLGRAFRAHALAS